VPPSVFIIEHRNSSLHRDWESTLGCQHMPVHRQLWDCFAPEQLGSCRGGLVVANAVPGGVEAIQFFRWLRQHPLSLPTFAILPAGDAELLQAGVEAADDFLLWPVRTEELRERVRRLLGPKTRPLEEIQASLAGEMGLQRLVGQDPAFLKVLAQVATFGASDAPVLLTGETGTGKELCARVIHLLSKRHKGPFIPVDCGALPDHLFENEFFGHARGAFTDARGDQKGLVTLSQNGTLFMDEIDDLSPATQGKVLRLLQEHTYRPLGSDQFRSANLRVVAATNRDLEKTVQSKQFRADLFFRINVLRLRLPALRDRRSDIAVLGQHFVEEVCRSCGIAKKHLSLSAIHKLEAHDWPGNIRELYNIMQRAVLASPGCQITAAAVETTPSDEPRPAADDFRSAKLQAIRKFERDYVREMLERYEGNVTRAARESHKDRRAFGRLVKKYGFQHGHA
jgi:DNA-binding NtrC family response regulator